MDTLIIVGTGFLLTLSIGLPYWLNQRRLEQEAELAERKSLDLGLDQPVSLHPIVSPGACIGTGNCLSACPEEDVLGLRHGRVTPVSPARCIGHGACESACPVDAITLVFGTAKRGVELPRVSEDFQTNVPGLYIVGELGGMGLIRNAFEQGRQCIEGIVAGGLRGRPDELDVLIVGCGPSGLSASINCQEQGLRFRTIDRDGIGGAVRSYPRKKLVMTHPLLVPGYGMLKFREIIKEDLIALWQEIVANSGIEIAEGVTMTGLRRLDGGGFEVETTTGHIRARHVVLAIGRRGTPRKLGIPGEDQSHVSYSLAEPSVFRGDRVLVVGGGDSAVEAALTLSEEPGTVATLSYRGDRLRRVKEANRRRVEVAQAEGRLRVLFETELRSIGERSVQYLDASGAVCEAGADAVFIFAGGVMPKALLTSCGVELDVKFGEAAR